MNHKLVVRYSIYLGLGILLLFLAAPVLREPLGVQSAIPLIVLIGLGLIFKEFVKRYRQNPPTRVLNMIQLGYIATLVIALYYSIVVLMNAL